MSRAMNINLVRCIALLWVNMRSQKLFALVTLMTATPIFLLVGAEEQDQSRRGVTGDEHGLLRGLRESLISKGVTFNFEYYRFSNVKLLETDLNVARLGTVTDSDSVRPEKITKQGSFFGLTDGSFLAQERIQLNSVGKAVDERQGMAWDDEKWYVNHGKTCTFVDFNKLAVRPEPHLQLSEMKGAPAYKITMVKGDAGTIGMTQYIPSSSIFFRPYSYCGFIGHGEMGPRWDELVFHKEVSAIREKRDFIMEWREEKNQTLFIERFRRLINDEPHMMERYHFSNNPALVRRLDVMGAGLVRQNMSEKDKLWLLDNHTRVYVFDYSTNNSDDVKLTQVIPSKVWDISITPCDLSVSVSGSQIMLLGYWKMTRYENITKEDFNEAVNDYIYGQQAIEDLTEKYLESSNGAKREDLLNTMILHE